MHRLITCLLTFFCLSTAVLEAESVKRAESYDEVVKRNASLADGKRLRQLMQGEKPLYWYFLGDSITQGALHVKGHKCFVQHCEEMIRWESQQSRRKRDCVVNSGVSGDTLAAYEKEASLRIHHPEADVVLINYGVNDVRSGIAIAHFEEQMKRLIAQVRESGAIPVLQVPSPVRGMKERDEKFRDVIRQLAQQQHCLLVDHPLFWKERSERHESLPSLWMNDALHPNYLGHRAMAQAISESLQLVGKHSATMKLPLK